MSEVASIPRRLNAIKKLARGYFDLEDGALIENHTQLLRVFDVRGSKHYKHPHKMARVYITRRALKHIIESRKGELLKRHSEDEAIEIICFAIENVQDTITHFDKYEFEPPSHCYVKDYSHLGRPKLRIALEEKEGRLEIKSVHFTKRN